jgi:hypothetical protein
MIFNFFAHFKKKTFGKMFKFYLNRSNIPKCPNDCQLIIYLNKVKESKDIEDLRKLGFKENKLKVELKDINAPFERMKKLAINLLKLCYIFQHSGKESI